MADQLIAEVETLSTSDHADELDTVAVIARAEGAIAQLKMLRHDPDAVQWAERAIVHARAAGDEWVEVQGMVERASTFLVHTDRTTAYAELTVAVEAATRLADGVLLSRALNNMMELLPPVSDEARRLRQQLRDTATASGFDKLGAQQVVWWDALAALAEGDLAAYRRLLDVWQSWRLSANDQPMLAIELVSLNIEEGRVADAREMMAGSIGGVGCGLIAEKPFMIGMLELRVAAAARDVVNGRAWFETLMAGTCPHDYWYVASDVFDLVWAALAVEIPADEVRRRV